MLVGVVPLLLGILFELIVVIPLRVPLEQSPLFFPWQVIEIFQIYFFLINYIPR